MAERFGQGHQRTHVLALQNRGQEIVGEVAARPDQPRCHRGPHVTRWIGDERLQPVKDGAATARAGQCPGPRGAELGLAVADRLDGEPPYAPRAHGGQGLQHVGAHGRRAPGPP